MFSPFVCCRCWLRSFLLPSTTIIILLSTQTNILQNKTTTKTTAKTILVSTKDGKTWSNIQPQSGWSWIQGTFKLINGDSTHTDGIRSAPTNMLWSTRTNRTWSFRTNFSWSTRTNLSSLTHLHRLWWNASQPGASSSVLLHRLVKTIVARPGATQSQTIQWVDHTSSVTFI